MKISLLALDVDGTLLDSTLTLRERTVAAVAAAVRAGVTVTIASGRMFRSARPLAGRLSLGDIPMITYNGALTKRCLSGRTISHFTIGKGVALDVVRWGEDEGCHINLFIDDNLYVARRDEKTIQYERQAGVQARVVGQLSLFLREKGGAPTKILFHEDEGWVGRWLERGLPVHLRGRVRATSSYPYFLEMVSPEVSKGRALQELALSLRVPREEVMAVGDGLNDLEMLRYAGVGVAMGNSPPQLKEAADYVTGDADDDGLAVAIERFILA